MIKEVLSLLPGKPNILDFPQSTINSFLIDDEDHEIFTSSVKIFSSKTKKHFTNKYAEYHIKNNFKFFDVVKFSKYPLPAAYNQQTNRCIINLAAFGRKGISNFTARDLYTLVVYGHVCSVMSAGYSISEEHADPFCEYMVQLFLKTFAKKYGITGAYVDRIPQLRFLVSLYMYVSFFGLTKIEAIKRASYFGKVHPSTLKIDFEKYDFSSMDGLLASLTDADITPGLNSYRFLETVIRNFGVVNLPIFEDIMRFSATMISSSINGNTYFTPIFQMYHPKLYFKVNTIIENAVDKAVQ